MEDVKDKERSRDKRLQNTYGITLAQYNAILAAQGGKCAVCGRPATDFTVSLNVDHKHFKVIAALNKGGEHPYKWEAHTGVGRGYVLCYGKTKDEAIKVCKKEAMPRSVRGLLCPGRYSGCNRLMGRIDKIDWLENVIAYLKDPPARKVLDSTSKK